MEGNRYNSHQGGNLIFTGQPQNQMSEFKKRRLAVMPDKNEDTTTNLNTE